MISPVCVKKHIKKVGLGAVHPEEEENHLENKEVRENQSERNRLENLLEKQEEH